jgi:hypothetical protein
MRLILASLLVAASARADVTPPPPGGDWRAACQAHLDRLVVGDRDDDPVSFDGARVTVGPSQVKLTAELIGNGPVELTVVARPGVEPKIDYSDGKFHVVRRASGRGAFLTAAKPLAIEAHRELVGAADACVREPAAAAEKGPVAPGRYRLDGAVVEDGCGGRIVLAAQHLDVFPDRVVADVVNRTYPRQDGAVQLVASGEFGSPGPGTCPGSNLAERWTLTASGEHLDGTLESSWRLAPECKRTCTVRFHVQGRRVGARR